MPFVQTGSTRLYYEVAGEGPPLVLLHGVGASGEVWKTAGYVDALSDRFTVVVVDIRGFGRSSPLADAKDFATATRVEDLRLILADLGIERALVFGFSLGGRMATAFAAEHPEQVSALIIASSNPHPPGTNQALAEGRSFSNRLRRLTPRSAVAAVRRRIYARLGLQAPPLESAYSPEQQAMLGEAMRRGYFTIDLERAVERITMPALFFQGDRDDLFSAELTRSFAEQLPRGEFVLLNGQPHGILERSDLLLPVVEPFLERHRQPA